MSQFKHVFNVVVIIYVLVILFSPFAVHTQVPDENAESFEKMAVACAEREVRKFSASLLRYGPKEATIYISPSNQDLAQDIQSRLSKYSSIDFTFYQQDYTYTELLSGEGLVVLKGGYSVETQEGAISANSKDTKGVFNEVYFNVSYQDELCSITNTNAHKIINYELFEEGSLGIMVGREGVLATIIIISLVFGSIGFVFWLWMIIDCATRSNFESKVVWIILMIFTGFLGALIYFFVVKLSRPKKK